MIVPAALLNPILNRLEAPAVVASASEAVTRRMAGDAASVSAGARMLTAARQLLATTTDSAYSHVPDIRPGYFRADCSELVDYLAGRVKPEALAELPLDAGHPQPRADNYFQYLKTRRAAGATAAGDRWARVPQPAQLEGGDVIAWNNDEYVPGKSSTGHVMLVSGVPREIRVGGRVAGYDVPVIDSTSHGHGPADDRVPGVKTGLGQGTVYFPVDARGEATGFSWSPAASHDAVRPPALAFGRLLD